MARPVTTSLRLAIALGDPERERTLLPALDDGDVVVTQRCLTADDLLAVCGDRQVDVALVGFDLHRLGTDALADLQQTRVPIVLLAPDPADTRWQSWPSLVLPLTADAPLVRQALHAARRGERLATDPTPAAIDPPAPVKPATARASVLAILSGHGSPGRTTVAIGLAAALGAVAPTVLVDLDLGGPSVAAHLDLDPTRNVAMVAHAEPSTPRDWQRALSAELQNLSGPRSPYGQVLAGVPKATLRATLTRTFVERLLAELRQRHQYVIVDLGAERAGTDTAAALQRAVPRQADQTLLVATPDIVGLWHARAALEVLCDQQRLEPERLATVLNRYDRRYHHAPADVAEALGQPVVAVIPFDHHGAQRALAAQQPLVLDGGRAARAVIDLAERVHGGRVLVPAATETTNSPGWRRALARVWRPRPAMTEVDGGDLPRDGAMSYDHAVSFPATR